jgi:hypothetical protein
MNTQGGGGTVTPKIYGITAYLIIAD